TISSSADAPPAGAGRPARLNHSDSTEAKIGRYSAPPAGVARSAAGGTPVPAPAGDRGFHGSQGSCRRWGSRRSSSLARAAAGNAARPAPLAVSPPVALPGGGRLPGQGVSTGAAVWTSGPDGRPPSPWASARGTVPPWAPVPYGAPKRPAPGGFPAGSATPDAGPAESPMPDAGPAESPMPDAGPAESRASGSSTIAPTPPS